MYQENVFFQAMIYLAAAVISVPLAKRVGLGSTLGYLVAGFVIGPYGLGLVGEEGQDVMHFAEFGVVMMLFLIGLELQPSLLWQLRRPIVGMGGLQVLVTTLLIASIALVMGFSWQVALAVGMILSLSSTAIVLQTLNEKGLLKTDGGQSSFSVLLFQDLAVIPILAILPLLAVGSKDGAGIPEAIDPMAEASPLWVHGLPAWGYTLVVLAVIAAIILGSRFLTRPVFRAIAKTHLREIFTAAALLMVIAIALLMTKVGLSPALGTFLAGVILADSEYRHELEADIEPFKGLLLGLFFIAVGASLDLPLIAERPAAIGLIVLGLVLMKFAVLFILGRAFRMGLDQNLLFAFALAQGSEFAFVLLSFGLQNHVLTKEVTDTLIAAVALSMALTPVLLLINERLVQPRVGTREREERQADEIDEENPVIIAGFGSFGSIVGRLLKANGVGITVLEIDSDKVEILRKLGLKVFYGDASRYDLLEAARAGRAKLFILAITDSEKVFTIIETVKKNFPHLTILARASDRTMAYELLDAGVDHVYRDTVDTSLRLGTDVLRRLGFRSHQAHRAARTFFRHDEDAVFELRHIRHDRKKYLTQARQRIEDLEQILLAELHEHEDQRDAGWDIK